MCVRRCMWTQWLPSTITIWNATLPVKEKCAPCTCLNLFFRHSVDFFHCCSYKPTHNPNILNAQRFFSFSFSRTPFPLLIQCIVCFWLCSSKRAHNARWDYEKNGKYWIDERENSRPYEHWTCSHVSHLFEFETMKF